MEQSNQFLGTEHIGKLMKRYAIPCIISLLVGALYNIVDQIFIANADYLGSYGNAANTVVFPLTVVALAIAVMIGDGCCAYVSIRLGRNEGYSARQSVGNAVVMTVVSSLLLTVIYLAASDSLISMFGGTVNEETFRLCREYFFYITLGIPFYMFGQAMNPIIRADGNPKFAMAVVGIVMKFFQIVISIVVGMAAGCIPIVGFNMGSGKRDLVKTLFTRLLLAEATVGAVAFILVEFFPRQLIGFFGAAGESVYYTQFAVKAFRVYLCMVILACINKACFIFLQSMGKAAASTILSMLREVVFGVGFALLLPLYFGLDGVLYSMPVSDFLTFAVAIVLIRQTYRILCQKKL